MVRLGSLQRRNKMKTEDTATLGWFGYCVGVYACGTKYLRSLGEQTPEFLALLEQANTVIDTTYQGDSQVFFSELSTDFENNIPLNPEKSAMQYIEEWLNKFF